MSDDSKGLESLRDRLARAQRGNAPTVQAQTEKSFSDSLNDVINAELETLEQKKFNRAMDSWLDKRFAECRGRILEYGIVIVFFCVVMLAAWVYFSTHK